MQTMELISVLKTLGISLGLGLLVGMQRERVATRVAGFRTFPLIAISGTLLALLAEHYGGWLIAAGLLSVGMITVIGNMANIKAGIPEPGLTTEFAMLVMYCIGAFLVIGPVTAAVVTGASLAVLLHLKPQLHAMAGKIGDRDFKAIMQFVLISLIILPVLPNENYGPYNVLNPFRIWLMVVLIVGISLAGFVIYKFFGSRVGTLAGGILGGLISSTATTVSYAKSCKDNQQEQLSLLVILTASAVLFPRLLLIIVLVAPQFFVVALGPLILLFAVLGIMTLQSWRATSWKQKQNIEQSNPSELKTALLFAFLYSVVLLVAAATRQELGHSALYVVACVSGLPNVDAISLTILEMLNNEYVVAEEAWRLILAACMANLLFKAGIVSWIGPRWLAKKCRISLGIGFVAGLAILLFYPA